MPMNAGGRVEAVGNVDANHVAFDGFERGAMNAAIVTPAFGNEAGMIIHRRDEFMRNWLRDQMKDLGTINHLPWQRHAIGRDDGFVVDAGRSKDFSLARADGGLGGWRFFIRSGGRQLVARMRVLRVRGMKQGTAADQGCRTGEHATPGGVDGVGF